MNDIPSRVERLDVIYQYPSVRPAAHDHGWPYAHHLIPNQIYAVIILVNSTSIPLQWL